MKKISVYLLFFGIVFFFFRPYFTQGKVPVAIDIPVGMYYPWLNQSFGYAVRPLVKNSILTDTVSQFWIWRNWSVDGVKNRQISIWNPRSLSGYEMSPWFHTIIFSPLNIFYFLFQKIDAMSWIVISQVLLSLFGGFFLGKQLYKSTLVGIGLAVAWTFSSFFTGWLTWGTVSATLAFLPWTLYLLEKNISQNKFFTSFLTVLLLSFMLLSGHPQTALYCYAIFFVWAIFKNQWKFGLIAIVLSMIISGVALFPSVNIIKNSIRGFDNQLTLVNSGFIPWPKIVGLLFSVNLFGNPATGNYFGGDYNFQEKLVNFGTIPFLLVIYFLIKSFYLRKITANQKIGVTLLIVGLLLATEYPLGWMVYKLHLPLVSSSPAGRAFVISIFGSIIIFADSLSEIVKQKIFTKGLFLSIGILVFGYLFVLGEIIYGKWQINSGPASLLESYSEFSTNLNISLRNLIVPFAVLISSGFLLVVLNFKKQFSKIIVSTLIFLVVFEGYLFFKKYTPFVPKDLYFPSTPSLTFVSEKYQNSQDFFRVERESAEILPPNMWEPYGFYSTSGYDPIGPVAYTNYLTKIGVQDGNSRYVENANHKIELLDNLGIRYLLTIKRDEASLPSPTGKVKYLYKEEKWKEVFSEGPVSVLENSLYQPPYFLSDGGALKLVEHRDDYWKFLVDSPEDTTLFLNENNSKNWFVLVNGQREDVKPFLETFKSVDLKSGTSSVEFVYYNQDLHWGALLSLFGLILTILLIKNKLIY